MAYKNIKDRRAASRRHYKNNKEKYLLRNSIYRSKIKEFIKGLKESSPCTDCGAFYPSCVMDFDHVNGQKSAEINFLTSTGRIAALKSEIKKCEIVCSNCHRLRTFNRSAV